MKCQSEGSHGHLLIRPGADLHVPDGVDASLGKALGSLPVSRVWSPGTTNRPLAVGRIRSSGDGFILSFTESSIGSVPGDVVSPKN